MSERPKEYRPLTAEQVQAYKTALRGSALDIVCDSHELLREWWQNVCARDAAARRELVQVECQLADIIAVKDAEIATLRTIIETMRKP
jgi:hypothetical protein